MCLPDDTAFFRFGRDPNDPASLVTRENIGPSSRKRYATRYFFRDLHILTYAYQTTPRLSSFGGIPSKPPSPSPGRKPAPATANGTLPSIPFLNRLYRLIATRGHYVCPVMWDLREAVLPPNRLQTGSSSSARYAAPYPHHHAVFVPTIIHHATPHLLDLGEDPHGTAPPPPPRGESALIATRGTLPLIPFHTLLVLIMPPRRRDIHLNRHRHN